MTRILLIAFAGALGTLARYGIGVAAGKTLGTSFPYGTLAVNVLGCFLMGAIAHVAVSSEMLSPTARLALTVGFLGGLTTYSSFNLETTQLLGRGAWFAVVNVGLTLVGCFVAGLVGMAAARRFVGP